MTLAAAIAAGAAGTAHAATCEQLLGLHLPDTVIHTAQSIPAGAYQPPGSTVAYSNLPAFCRVTATVSPVSGSAIGIEIWLPTATWNHRYQQSGNHGLGGTFYWGEMVGQLQRGYATAITDDGHTASQGAYDTAFAFGSPQRVTDFAWRAVHQLAEKAKWVIAAFYGQPQRHAYFNGCSDGGREAMKSAQRFPRDFDGIIAGSAVADYTGNATKQLVTTLDWAKAGIVGASGASLLTRVQAAEMAQCDARDGLTDGQIRDPRACHWQPASLSCKAGQNAAGCLTPQQAQAVEANESALRDPRTGQWLMAAMTPGSEHDENRFGFTNGPAGFGVANYRIGLGDPNWDGSNFDLARDFPILERNFGDEVNAVDPDLTAFQRAGGKLIQWHGWDDVVAQPGYTVKYYDEVVDASSQGDLRATQDFYRLFMLPGIGHCGTGIGPDNIGQENYTAVSPDPEHDVVSALEAWVERGVKPAELIATKFVNGDPAQGVQQQRPICPYPAEAIYNGAGDPNAASSFHCGVPPHHAEADAPASGPRQ
ncbi:tannase/feruloyl esterase family alpha/beta hydrolase [Burkholderia sp. 22PA0106]|uniref:tannase/feruloyl esterase family alpha/beta hydrolase n=1 Tax=Burkholderia sp. 22PA0106 TaxID=3237371 RepID=UPI0039C054FD